MSKIRTRGRLWPALVRQLDRATTEYVNDERRAFVARNCKPEKWEDHIEAWLHFSINNPSLDVGFAEWERLRRRDQRPGQILLRP